MVAMWVALFSRSIPMELQCGVAPGTTRLFMSPIFGVEFTTVATCKINKTLFVMLSGLKVW